MEIEGADELQTLVLMNPAGYVYYSDSIQSQQGDFAFLDSNVRGNIPVNHHRLPVEMVAAPPPEVKPFQQGLSLSLSRYAGVTVSPACGDRRAAVRGGGGGGGSPENMMLNSKYLKATRELLEEVVNVGKVVTGEGESSKKPPSPPPVTGGETTDKSGSITELSTVEKQEIQMKKSKLVNMLDEVEQRYRHYYHQMQLVISWFEQVAGIGSAKTYTSLALQTISKQFRCLKDTITRQIKAASVSLGEEDGGGGSRLRLVDNQLRQQRALHQLGMIQHNAWRPQRGLPERSVSVLRAWLFEHFLHPYPKDSDKHMLAKQTGLTRSQVSNWFINARVRLWKPMVEEMYLEEIKDQEENGTKDDKPNKNDGNDDVSSSKQGKIRSPENSTSGGFNFQNPSGFSLIGPQQIEQIAQFSPKKPRYESHQPNQNGGFMGGLGGYSVGDIGDQFQQHYSGNGVSLTLGLPHCDKNLSISGSHDGFLPNQTIQIGRRGAELGEEDGYAAMNPPSSSHTAALYETMNIQNRKRFAAQPLPDFVA